jgi:hypothetical protein
VLNSTIRIGEIPAHESRDLRALFIEAVAYLDGSNGKAVRPYRAAGYKVGGAEFIF